jgi:hypothetical protein
LKHTSAKSILTFLVIGILVAAISMKSIGVTAALSTPTDFSSWFKANEMMELGILVWELVVVFGMGIGVLTFATLLAVFRFVLPATLGSLLAFFIGVLAMAYLIVPLVNSMPINIFVGRPWYSFGFELAVLVSAVAAYLIAIRMKNKPAE